MKTLRSVRIPVATQPESPPVRAEPESESTIQGCVIPYRFKQNRIQVCLVSLRSGRGWGFPKGRVSKREEVAAAALREAYEEAGIRGVALHSQPVGEYREVKGGKSISVQAFIMHVTVKEKTWPESRGRRRLFCSVRKARELVVIPAQRQLLDATLAHLAKQRYTLQGIPRPKS